MSKKLNKKIEEYVISHCERVPRESIIRADFSLSNGACHFNAVAAVRAGRADSVWLVVALGEEGAVVHFINSYLGEFFDETWHEYDEKHHYYILKEVMSDEYSSIETILMGAKRAIVRVCGTKKDMLKLLKGRLSL